MTATWPDQLPDQLEEIGQLRATVRRFLAATSGRDEVRRLIDAEPGYDPAVWRQMADQLGLQGLAIPEEYGGSGFSHVESGVVFEEMGRALFTGPYWSTVGLAAPLLLATDDEAAKHEWLPRIADGSLVATVAVTDERDGSGRGGSGRGGSGRDGSGLGGSGLGGSSDLAVRATVTASSGEWNLTGRKTLVSDGQVADLLIVTARTAEGLGIFAVDGDGPGVSRTPLASLDLTRRLCTVELSSARARLITTDGAQALARALDLAVVALAAEQAGAAQRCLETAVSYAKTRVQFGRPIGSFQSIKHKCADMLLRVESAKAAAAAAAVSAAGAAKAAGAAGARGDAGDLPMVAALAGAYCSEAFCEVAMENIQIHGGMGFTWEHDAHLYLRRALSSRVLLRSPKRHRRRIADLIGL